MIRRRPAVIASLALATACSPGDPAAVDVAASTDESLEFAFESIARAYVDSDRVIGCQYAIVDRGEIVSIRALGLADREARRPMTADTPVNVASVSKSLTAWGVLRWLRASDTAISTPIRRLLDGVEIAGDRDAIDAVTVGQLLSHTSGLSTPSVPVTSLDDALPSIADVLAGRSSVARAEIQHVPGTTFAYSGAGYLLLQLMLEAQTGESFDAFMRKTVLGPAGMPQSTFAPALIDNLAPAVYYQRGGRRREPYHLPGAAGGLYSTANDIAQFLRLYSVDSESGGEPLLPADAFAQLLNPIVQVDGTAVGPEVGYALGHYIVDAPDGERLAFHAGGNPGLRAFFVMALKRRSGFFVVVNDVRGDALISGFLRAWSARHGVPEVPYGD